MWCAILGFIGGLVAAPVLAIGAKPVIKRVVVGGIVVGNTVSDWAAARADDWQGLVAEAKTEAAGSTKATPASRKRKA